jgi:hypothetical protein
MFSRMVPSVCLIRCNPLAPSISSPLLLGSQQQEEANWFKNAAKPEMNWKAVLHLKNIVEGESIKEKTT